LKSLEKMAGTETGVGKGLFAADLLPSEKKGGKGLVLPVPAKFAYGSWKDTGELGLAKKVFHDASVQGYSIVVGSLRRRTDSPAR
jgi:hypothetical protein